MKYILTYIFLLGIQLSFAQEYTKDDTCCMSKFHGQDFDSLNVSALSQEYRRLSALHTLCCDPWNSDLHLVMLRLGKYFGKNGTLIKDIIREMGMPDGTEKELAYAAIGLDDDEKALVYFWRSYHDFLYFVYEDDQVKYADWFMWGD